MEERSMVLFYFSEDFEDVCVHVCYVHVCYVHTYISCVLFQLA